MPIGWVRQSQKDRLTPLESQKQVGRLTVLRQSNCQNWIGFARGEQWKPYNFHKIKQLEASVQREANKGLAESLEWQSEG